MGRKNREGLPLVPSSAVISYQVPSDRADSKDDATSRSTEKSSSSKSCCHRTTWVEVPLFIYLVSCRTVVTLRSQFLVAFAAEMLGGPPENITNDLAINAGDAISNATRESLNEKFSNEVQKQSSFHLMYLNLCSNVPALFSVVIICAATEVTGRRLGLFLPLLGGVIQSSPFVLTIRYGLPFHFLYLGEFFEGISGSLATIENVSCLYLADIISPCERTFRFSVLQSFFYLGSALGNLCSGYLVDRCGFMYAFLFCAVVFTLGAIFVFALLQDSIDEDTRKSRTFSVKKTLIE